MQYVGANWLIGKVATHIVAAEDEIKFTFTDGSVVAFIHEQNCCESVYVSDVNGNWKDLIDTPILESRESTNIGDSDTYESCTYTFYTFRTIKGSVDVTWRGVSNGCYSERVSIRWENVNDF
jgi:hypothetical protein